MFSQPYIILVLLVEVLLFLAELSLSVISKKNKRLSVANTLDDIDFINLSKGYKTSISIFRISLFITFLLLMVLDLTDVSISYTDSLLFSIIAFLLIYLVSLLNVKNFIFYDDHFSVRAPFNFFRATVNIDYDQISDFRLYRALYNSYYLSIQMNNGEKKRIQFSGSSLPRNDLVIRIILNTKTGLKKDFRELRNKDDVF